MAENTLLKEQLTKEMIEAGAQLTMKLDELGLPLVASLWLFSPDSNEWRLNFASGELAKSGPRKVYEKVAMAREQIGAMGEEIPLSDIGLMDENSQLVRLLRMAIRTGPGISRLRFTQNSVNGHFFDDALIYRIV